MPIAPFLFTPATATGATLDGAFKGATAPLANTPAGATAGILGWQALLPLLYADLDLGFVSSFGTSYAGVLHSAPPILASAKVTIPPIVSIMSPKVAVTAPLIDGAIKAELAPLIMSPPPIPGIKFWEIVLRFIFLDLDANLNPALNIMFTATTSAVLAPGPPGVGLSPGGVGAFAPTPPVVPPVVFTGTELPIATLINTQVQLMSQPLVPVGDPTVGLQMWDIALLNIVTHINTILGAWVLASATIGSTMTYNGLFMPVPPAPPLPAIMVPAPAPWS